MNFWLRPCSQCSHSDGAEPFVSFTVIWCAAWQLAVHTSWSPLLSSRTSSLFRTTSLDTRRRSWCSTVSCSARSAHHTCIRKRRNIVTPQHAWSQIPLCYLVQSWSQTCSELKFGLSSSLLAWASRSATSFEPDSVMEFGLYKSKTE